MPKVFPFPDDLPPRSLPFAREVIRRMEELERAQSFQASGQTATAFSVGAAVSVPDANTEVSGKARLATTSEAYGDYRTPGDLDNTTVITPYTLDKVLSAYGPSPYGHARRTMNWEHIGEPGTSFFYSSAIWDDDLGALVYPQNAPPGNPNNTYIGTRITTNEWVAIHAAGGAGPVIWDVFEVDMGSLTIVTRWVATGWGSAPIAWEDAGVPVIPDASTTVKGIVELATNAETTTGTSTTLATTPAGVKAVADTKAALVHGHALTDANITGILPIAQVPTGTTGATVALGNHTHTSTGITDFATAVPAAVPVASETVQGKVELATLAERMAGTSNTLAITPSSTVTPIMKIVGAGGTSQAMNPSTWYQMVSTFSTTPLYSSGFGTWSSGILTIQSSGIYQIMVNIGWQTNPTPGRLFVRVLRNSTDPNDSTATVVAGLGYGINGSLGAGLATLTAGDVLRVYAYQEGASPRNTDANGLTYITAQWVSPQL